ncbi:ataxin-2 isoform X5 [Salmo trutta]|uniref:ataxin-2 isoform X5 n=1 Tax=Salmo trutta TaxID=8032 RepID=UPI001131A7D2|nr:ataxin-2-like isoform X5 [Salmo trutta]
MSMKQAGGNRKPGGGAAAGAGRQNLGRGRHSAKGTSAAVVFNGVYANMRMVHVLTSVVRNKQLSLSDMRRGLVFGRREGKTLLHRTEWHKTLNKPNIEIPLYKGSKCELKVKNGLVYDGVFKTYGPECDLVLDAAHRKIPKPSEGPRQEDIVESIIFKASDVVVVHFRDVDLNFASKISTDTDNFTDTAVSGRINGEHKKDLEPWDGGAQQQHVVTGSLESLDTDVSNGWDPNDMFKYNEEQYGIMSTYDSSLSTYTVALERDNSEEFLKREARAAQLAQEIEASATYKARVALENDERTEEEKYSAVVRGEKGERGEREPHTLNRENKYIPPGQRNREGMSWGAGRQNSPKLVQSSSGPPRSGAHDYSPSSGADQRVLNGGTTSWPSPCPSPSLRPPFCYQSGPSSLPTRVATPTRPPSRPPSRASRPSSHPSAHGAPALVSTMPNRRMSSEGPPRMSPKTQRTPRTHRVPPGGRVPPGVDFMPHNAPGEVPVPPPTRSSSSGGTWSSVVSGAHRPRSPRQNSMGGASPGPSSLPLAQTGTTPVEPASTQSASSPTAASPARDMAATPSAEAKESRVQEKRQNSPTANKENMKPLESPPSISRPLSKGPPSMAPDHRKQIDNLKKFSVDFRLQSSSNPDPQFEQMMTKPPPDAVGEKPKELPLDKGLEGSEEGAVAPTGSSKAGSPGAPSSSSTLCTAPEQKRGPDVTSQGVQTSAPTFSGGAKPEDKEEKEPVKDQIIKSTLNPNAHEFKPRVFNTQPKPATTPTPPRPQGQPSPSIVVQQPQQVYSQTVCFPQMYPLTPVSPGVQSPAMYHVQMPHMTVSQSKPYRPGKVANMPQQRSDQHHPQGTPTMMHPAQAGGPPIVAQSPTYSAQYFTCSPQQFTSQQLMQQMPHYQSQAQHVFSPVMQSQARMMAPPNHGQPGQLVSSSTTQYGEQTHTMYVSQGPMPQQYQHPQPSATPTGQAQQGGQHGGNHPAPSPVQQHQAAAAQALHMGNQPQQQMYQALAPTPPSMTPGTNPQSPQGSFPSAQQAVYLHPQQMQHGYNPSHMAHMQQVSSTFRSPSLHSEYILYEQAHMQSGMVPSHPQMMLMATQQPGGPQPQLPQNALNPIPVSSTTHFSYLAHPQVQQHHQ